MKEVLIVAKKMEMERKLSKMEALIMDGLQMVRKMEKVHI